MNRPSISPAADTGTDSPEESVREPAAALGGKFATANVGAVRQIPRNPILSTPAGESLHGCVITAEDHALEQEILDSAAQAAQEQARGNTDGAVMWTKAMLDAIGARRPEVVLAWVAHEREFLDSLDYFGSDAAHQGRTAG